MLNSSTQTQSRRKIGSTGQTRVFTGIAAIRALHSSKRKLVWRFALFPLVYECFLVPRDLWFRRRLIFRYRRTHGDEVQNAPLYKVPVSPHGSGPLPHCWRSRTFEAKNASLGPEEARECERRFRLSKKGGHLQFLWVMIGLCMLPWSFPLVLMMG